MPGNPKINLDFEMVESCKKGDQNSFRELYELFKDRVYSTAYRMLGNSEEARDAAQDTFIKVFRNIHHFREDSSLLTWVYRITVNTCIDKAKNLKKRENEYPLEHPEDISSAVPSGDTGGLLNSILEKEVQNPEICLCALDYVKRMLRNCQNKLPEFSGYAGSSRPPLFRRRRICLGQRAS